MKRIYPRQIFEGQFSGWYGKHTYYDLAVRHSKFEREVRALVLDIEVERFILDGFRNKKRREPGPRP